MPGHVPHAGPVALQDGGNLASQQVVDDHPSRGAAGVDVPLPGREARGKVTPGRGEKGKG